MLFRYKTNVHYSDMETQMPMRETIESFGDSSVAMREESVYAPSPVPVRTRKQKESGDTINCECGINVGEYTGSFAKLLISLLG